MKEQEIIKHIPLIKKVIKDLHCRYRTEEEYQEYYSIGTLGLVKGARSYDGSSKPSTYLYACIKKEILHMFAYNSRQKRYGQVESLNQPIITGDESSGELQDTIASDENIENQFQERESYENLYRAINRLKPYKRKIIIENYGIGCTRKTIRELAKENGRSRTAINNALESARRQIKDNLDQIDKEQKKKARNASNRSVEDLLKEQLYD